MARKVPPLKLSSLNAGVHSSERIPKSQGTLSPDRCVRALNVEESFGYLKRRPAFKSIAHGPQFIFPAGQSVTYYNSLTSYNRTFAVSGTYLNGGYIYVGCDNKFDGIFIPKISLSAATVSAHRSIKVEFSVDTTTWSEFYNPIDFTVGRNVNSSNIYYHTLTQRGTITWHRLITDNEFNLAGARTWANVTPTGLPAAKYWVRLSLVSRSESPSVSDTLGGATLTCSLPGVLPFQLEAVNSIIPARAKNGKPTIFFCGDRQNLRSRELGAQIGAWSQLSKAPKVGFKVEDEGAGVMGADVPPANFYGTTIGTAGTPTAGARPWNTTGWAATDATAAWIGASDRLTKSDQTYEWMSNQSAASATPYAQWRGAAIYTDISPSASCTNDATTNRTTIPVSITGLKANSLEHCFIRVKTQGTSSVVVGEEDRQILSNTTSSIVCYPAMSDTPGTDTVFHIYKPHSKAQFSETEDEQFVFYNFPHYFQFNHGGGLNPINYNPANPDNGWYHFYLGRELQWTINRNDFWTSCYDEVTQQHLLTNGKSGILTYDGKYFREMQAFYDPTSIRVSDFLLTTGAFSDPSQQIGTTQRLALTALRHKVPPGHFITYFNHRVVIADERTIYWSLSGTDTDIWPNKYTQDIRDPFNNEITGMAELGDRLVIFTPTSIHSSPPADDQGFFNFQLESAGVGFLSHRAVAKFFIDGSPALIGPSADGIRIYSPGSQSPVPILDNWQQVFPGGINTGLLRNSVGCISKLQNRYYIAVPRAGFTVCDIILVFDFTSKSWYVWKFPYGGVTSIARDFDEAGNERILFGAYDGTVSVMVDKEYDDGDNSNGVNWYAISPPIEFNGSTVAPTAIVTKFDDIDPSNTVTLSTYINGRIDADDTSSVVISDSTAVYGTGTYGTSTFASEGDVTTKVNLPTGTRCETFQFGLSGTKRFLYKGSELLATIKGQRSK